MRKNIWWREKVKTVLMRINNPCLKDSKNKKKNNRKKIKNLDFLKLQIKIFGDHSLSMTMLTEKTK